MRQVQESRPKPVELTIRDLETKLREKIDTVADELIELAQRRIQEEVAAALEPLVQGAVERVYSAVEEESARAGEGIQGLLSGLVQGGQAQVAHILQSATSEFRQELYHISGTAIASAQAEIAQAWSKSAAGFEARLQETAGQVVESASRQLQQQVNMLCSLLSSIEKEVARVFSQAKKEVAQALTQSSLQLLESTWKKLSCESQALPEQIEASLKKAADNIEQNWLERIRGKQQEAAHEIIEATAAQLGKQLEQSLDFFSGQLKLRQERAARDAAEALRSRIGEMLSAFQSPRSNFAP